MKLGNSFPAFVPVLPNEFACLHLSTGQDTEDDEDEEMAAGDEEDGEEDEDDEEGEGSPGSKFWYMHEHLLSVQVSNGILKTKKD